MPPLGATRPRMWGDGWAGSPASANVDAAAVRADGPIVPSGAEMTGGKTHQEDVALDRGQDTPMGLAPP